MINEKCGNCMNSRTVISENGFHPICTLSPFDAARCVANNYQLYTTPNLDLFRLDDERLRRE